MKLLALMMVVLSQVPTPNGTEAWYQWGSLGIVGAAMGALLYATIPALLREIKEGRGAYTKSLSDSHSNFAATLDRICERHAKREEGFESAIRQTAAHCESIRATNGGQ